MGGYTVDRKSRSGAAEAQAGAHGEIHCSVERLTGPEGGDERADMAQYRPNFPHAVGKETNELVVRFAYHSDSAVFCLLQGLEACLLVVTFLKLEVRRCLVAFYSLEQ